MRYLSSILVLLLSISSFAINQYKFRLIDIVDGLSDNQIRGLSITPDGRIAVRTASIMNIYNGTTFEYFHYDKKQNVSAVMLMVQFQVPAIQQVTQSVQLFSY